MPDPRLVVCIATTGRPAILTETLRDVARQTRRPDAVFVCPAKDGDVEGAALAALDLGIEFVRGSVGLPRQRNALLRACRDADIVLFIDDDFLLAEDYVARTLALFAREPSCVVATGHVLADGATGPGYSVAEGRAILAAHPVRKETYRPHFAGYGCNMAINWARLRDSGCWFDEALPLYAWAEDVDFSRQAARHGIVLKSEALVGVHLAAKTGRVSGVRFGYSQIANQVYLARKGTLPVVGCLRKALENIAANALGAVRNAGMIDRRGRLVGNLYGIRDVLTGRSHPGRVLDL